MNANLPDSLWIGHAGDARNPGALFDAGIAAVVDVAYEEPPATLPREIIYCRFPLLDGEGNQAAHLTLAVKTVAWLLIAEIPSLIACSSGLSRSPAIAAAALSQVRGGSPEEWLETIAQARPHDISSALWHDIVKAMASTS